MAVKQKILDLLEQNRGKFVSGSEAACQIGATRSAVWKAVSSLRAEGYDISAVTNRGYCLNESSEMLSEQGISELLTTREIGRKLDIFKGSDSSADFARSIAALGAAHGMTIISRNFEKPVRRRVNSAASDDTGIYMSIIIRRSVPENKIDQIRMAAAAAAAETIAAETGLPCGVSGNFLVCGGKNVGYYDFETVSDKDSDFLIYGIADIGICVSAGGSKGKFTPLRSVTTAVIRKNRLSAGIMNRLEEYIGEQDISKTAERFNELKIIE